MIAGADVDPRFDLHDGSRRLFAMLPSLSQSSSFETRPGAPQDEDCLLMQQEVAGNRSFAAHATKAPHPEERRLAPRLEGRGAVASFENVQHQKRRV